MLEQPANGSVLAGLGFAGIGIILALLWMEHRTEITLPLRMAEHNRAVAEGSVSGNLQGGMESSPSRQPPTTYNSSHEESGG
jgi:hypothetical protein